MAMLWFGRNDFYERRGKVMLAEAKEWLYKTAVPFPL